MNRAPITNGHSTEATLARSGYDAYFTQIEERSEAAVTESEKTGGYPRPPEQGVRGASSAGPSSPPPREGAQRDGNAAGPISAPEPPRGPSLPGSLGGNGSASASAPSGSATPPNQAVPAAEPAARPQSSTDAGTVRPEAQAATTGQPAAQQQAAYEPPPANQGPYTHGNGPAAANAEPARVPGRIERVGYEPSPRVEVLPPALSSVELLADIAAVRQAHLLSNNGVRGALNKVGFKLGLSPAEQRAEERRNRIRRQLTTTYQIAVISVKGGVGRTTTAAALGSTFASLRPDRVIAIDANPDFGDLSTRTARHPYGLTLRDLAQAQQRLDAFSAVHAYTSVNAADLAVIASPWNTDATEALTGTEYTTGVEILRRHYNLLLVDCGTGVLDSATNTVLRTSDAVVVVTPATVGGVTGAVATLNWLSSHGFDHLIANSVVAIVHHQPSKPTVEVSAIEKLFATAQRPTCEIPYDAHLSEGGEIDLRLLDKDTALAFEELAAGLADNFPGFGPGGQSVSGDRGGFR
uniref:MinD/ParA family ATP-binding protein n=1 Tax=Nocardia donostiensis TaxID=1538463 RepID=UPI0009D98D31|nr:MinD/ParA family protein [Nocardia donostiensis]